MNNSTLGFNSSEGGEPPVFPGLLHSNLASKHSIVPNSDPVKSSESTINCNASRGVELPVSHGSTVSNHVPAYAIVPSSNSVNHSEGAINFNASGDVKLSVSCGSVDSNPAPEYRILQSSDTVKNIQPGATFGASGVLASCHMSQSNPTIEHAGRALILIPSSGDRSSGNHSFSASNIYHPEIQQQFKDENPNRTHNEIPPSSNLPSGNKRLVYLPSGTPVSGNMSLEFLPSRDHFAEILRRKNRPSTYRKVHPDFQHLVNNANTNKLPLRRLSTPVEKLSPPVGLPSNCNARRGVELPVSHGSTVSNHVPACAIVPSNNSVNHSEGTINFNASGDVKLSVSCGSVDSNPAPEYRILQSSDTVKNNQPGATFGASGVLASCYMSQSNPTIEHAGRALILIPSSGDRSSGNHSFSASNIYHPEIQQQIKDENPNRTHNEIPPSSNLPSGTKRLVYLPSGTPVSGNMSLEFLPSRDQFAGILWRKNRPSTYRKVHPDFQHLVNNANTNKLPLRRLSTPVEKLSPPVGLPSALTEEPPTPYRCSKCPLGFSREADLKKHILAHCRNCPYCSETFFSRTPTMELLKHVVLCHKDKDPSSLVDRSTVETSLRGAKSGQYRCCHCGDEFNSLRACLEHRVYSHMVKECWICQKTFRCVSHLKDHIRSHTGEKSWSCPQCSKSFSSSRNVAKHMKVHTGNNAYRCEHCSFAAGSRQQLEVHKNKHTGAKPFKCQYCPMSYGAPGRLKIHERTHTGEKPYACLECDRAFIDKYSLVRHERIHTGEKPYKCGYCDRGFSQGGQLQLHERTHTGEKPFDCSQCGKKFSRGQELKKHLAMHEKRKSEKQIADQNSDSDDVEDLEVDREMRLASLRSSKQGARPSEVDEHLASYEKRKRKVSGKEKNCEKCCDSNDVNDEDVERESRLASLRSSKKCADGKEFSEQLAATHGKRKRESKSKAELPENDSNSDDVEYAEQDREERLGSLRSSKQSPRRRSCKS